MLSKIDIEKELACGGINIVPFKSSNIKENSINLCASKYAWATENGTIYYDRKRKRYQMEKPNNEYDVIKVKKGSHCVYKCRKENGTKYCIVMLPNATTLIETKEVIAVGGHIGGTYHSKVGIVSQGLGHIGTMLGPNFAGHSLIALHNITDEVILLDVGKSFVSIVFHYLKTPIYSINPTMSGHLDKFAELGIQLDSDERDFLTEDWKCDKVAVYQKMQQDKHYTEYIKQLKKEKRKQLMQFVSFGNFVRIMLILLILSVLLYSAVKSNNEYLRNLCVDVFGTGVLVAVITQIVRGIKPKR